MMILGGCFCLGQIMRGKSDLKNSLRILLKANFLDRPHPVHAFIKRECDAAETVVVDDDGDFGEGEEDDAANIKVMAGISNYGIEQMIVLSLATI
ncbi:hypothetical protein EJB05_49130, partial [Eragrostis curvula]